MSEQEPKPSPFSGVDEALQMVAKQHGIRHLLIYYTHDDEMEAVKAQKPQAWASHGINIGKRQMMAVAAMASRDINRFTK